LVIATLGRRVAARVADEVILAVVGVAAADFRGY
jgi:hypothetical protein